MIDVAIYPRTLAIGMAVAVVGGFVALCLIWLALLTALDSADQLRPRMFILLIPFLFMLLMGLTVAIGAFLRSTDPAATTRLFGLYVLSIGAWIRGAHKMEWLLLDSYHGEQAADELSSGDMSSAVHNQHCHPTNARRVARRHNFPRPAVGTTHEHACRTRPRNNREQFR